VSGAPPLDGLLVIRQERVAFASAGISALLGIPAGELVGRPVQEFLPPEDQARLMERHRRRLRGEPVPSDYELTVLGAGGRRLHVELSAALDAGPELVVRLRDLSRSEERRVGK
jgi:PAS domain S-box-containing protein